MRSLNAAVICYLCILFYASFAQKVAVEIKSGDRIIFLGGQHIFSGAAFDHGFISIFSTALQSQLSNVSVSYLGGNGFNLKSLVDEYEWYKTTFSIPDKVIVMAGTDDIVERTSDDLSTHFFNFHVIVSKLVLEGISVILCTPFFQGGVLE